MTLPHHTCFDSVNEFSQTYSGFCCLLLFYFLCLFDLTLGFSLSALAIMELTLQTRLTWKPFTASASWVLGLKAWATTTYFPTLFLRAVLCLQSEKMQAFPYNLTTHRHSSSHNQSSCYQGIFIGTVTQSLCLCKKKNQSWFGRSSGFG